jgi:hypothetical protein
VLTALYLHQAVMLALLSLKAFPWAPLMLPASAATALFHSAAGQLLARPSQVTALQDARRLDQLEQQEQEGPSGLTRPQLQGLERPQEQLLGLLEKGWPEGSQREASEKPAGRVAEPAGDAAHKGVGISSADGSDDSVQRDQQGSGGGAGRAGAGGVVAAGSTDDKAPSAAALARQLYLSPAFRPCAAELAALLAEVDSVRCRLAGARREAAGSGQQR